MSQELAIILALWRNAATRDQALALADKHRIEAQEKRK